MSLPHNFPFILFTEMKEILHFSYEKVKLYLIISTLNKCKIMFTPISFDIFWYGDVHVHVHVGAKIQSFKIVYMYIYKIY